jgi:hypothetical protein
MPSPTLFLSPSLPPSLSPARPLSCYTSCPADRATTMEGETSAVHVQKRKRARNRLRKEEEEEGLFKATRVNEVDAKADPQEREARALRERGVRGQVEQQVLQVWIMLRDVDHLRVLLHSLDSEGVLLRSLDSKGDGDDGGVGAEGQVVRILKSPLYCAVLYIVPLPHMIIC